MKVISNVEQAQNENNNSKNYCFHHFKKIFSNAIQFKQTSKDPKISEITCSEKIPNSLQSK